jgi:hypothetical protein
MKGRMLAALVCAVVVLPAHAADALTTASQLYYACRAPKKSPSYTLCRGYIAGYFDAFAQAYADTRPKRFCPGYGRTVEQIWKKVEPLLKPRHEQLEDETVELALGIALLAAYPCEEAKEQPK